MTNSLGSIYPFAVLFFTFCIKQCFMAAWHVMVQEYLQRADHVHQY